MRPIFKYLSAAFLITAAAATALAGPLDALRAIDAAEASGRMSRAQAALNRLYAHRAPERLNPGLSSRVAPLSTDRQVEKCATLEILAIRRALPELAPSDRREAEALLGIPEETSASRISPLVSPLVVGKAVTHSLEYWVETDNFSIEWGQNLTNEDGTLPLRDEDSDQIPDVIELWASYFENSYAQIKALGFTSASDLDTYKVKVYIANTDPNTAADNMNSGYYGVTNGAMPHNAGTPPPYVTVNGNMASIVAIAPNDESAKGQLFGIRGAMMVTAAHELHHVFQFLYAPDSWANPVIDAANTWFMEATSTWVEDEIYPFVNDYKQYFVGANGWQNFPWMTVAVDSERSFSSNAVRITRIYGSAIFPKYLSEHIGGPAILADVWDGLSSGLQFDAAVAGAANTAAGTVGVWTMAGVFAGFAGANASMDYDDGSFYGDAPRGLSDTVEQYGSYLSDHTMDSDGSQAFSYPPAGGGGAAASVAVTLTKNDADESYTIVLPSSAQSAAANALTGEVLTGIIVSPVSLPGLSGFSSATATDTTPPDDVGTPTVTPAPSGFEISWGEITDDVLIAGYVVEWRKEGATKWLGRCVAGRTIFQAHIGNLDPLSDYEVRVFGYDAAGNRGAPSETVTATTLAGIGYPSETTVVFSSPWFDRIASKTVAPGEPVTFTVTAHDADGHNLEYGAINLPGGAAFNLTTQAFSWTPTAAQAGDHTITFLASDGLTNVSLKVDITVTGTGGGGGGGGGGGCLIETLSR